MRRQQTTLKVSGNSNRFVDCSANGPVEISGRKNIFQRFRISMQNDKYARKLWENPLVLTVLGIIGTVGVAYLTHKLNWD